MPVVPLAGLRRPGKECFKAIVFMRVSFIGKLSPRRPRRGFQTRYSMMSLAFIA